MESTHKNNCVMCRRGLYHGRYQCHLLTDEITRLDPDITAYIQEHAVLEAVFDNTRSICHRCWQRARTAIKPLPVEEVNLGSEPTGEINVPEYSRAPNTANRCIFKNCKNKTRHRIPDDIKSLTFVEHRLYIPFGARVCHEHLENNNWADLPNNCNASHDFNAEHFVAICDMMRNSLQRVPRQNFKARKRGRH